MPLSKYPRFLLLCTALVLPLASHGGTGLVVPQQHSTGLSTTPERQTACVDVEVNGYRGLSYECLGQQMTPQGNHTSERERDATPESEAITRRPANGLGLVTPSTLSNRMGSNFGSSALPQRPSRPNNGYLGPLPTKP